MKDPLEEFSDFCDIMKLYGISINLNYGLSKSISAFVYYSANKDYLLTVNGNLEPELIINTGIIESLNIITSPPFNSYIIKS